MDIKTAAIMIVDDNAPMRTLIRHILERAGYTNIVEAYEGHSAFRILKSQKIDVIVSDWNMLGMTGIELLKKVREDRDVSQTPFIMLTVEGLNVRREEAIAYGVNDFISKPFTSRELLDRLERTLGATP